MNYEEEKKEKTGKTAAEQNTGNSVRKTVPTLAGNVGVRATLNNMGIDDSLIGFNEADGTVTLGGKTLLKPAYYDDSAGITYAPEREIRRSVVDFYKDSGNPVVKVTDAYAALAGAYGLSADAIGYTNDTVTIGGMPVSILYVDDEGKAWARQSDVQDSVDRYVSAIGAASPNQLLQQYNAQYLPQIQALTDRLINRADFAYDPDTDPLYQAYREKYTREAARAAENTMANYASLTGGYANSAAATAGALAQQYYMKQITDAIPDFAQQAYTRYTDRYQQDAEMADRLLQQYSQVYQNAEAANRRTLENANQSSASSTQRDADSFERYWQARQNQTADTWTNSNNRFQQAWDSIFNAQQQRENDLAYEIESLNRDQLKRYLEQYYGQLMDTELEAGELDNEISRMRLRQMIREYTLGY